jgi:hypothetical protein
MSSLIPWRYQRAKVTKATGYGDFRLDLDTLNDLGAEGWEFVGMDGKHDGIFKRPARPSDYIGDVIFNISEKFDADAVAAEVQKRLEQMRRAVDNRRGQ